MKLKPLASGILIWAIISVSLNAASPAGSVAASLEDYRRGHPRLLASGDDFARLARLVRESPRHAELFERVLAQADALLATPPIAYTMHGKRLTSGNRTLGRITYLALAAKVTGDDRYRDRMLEDLRAVCAFPDWNPSHFLDTSKLGLAVSIGYDWFYDELSEADRSRFVASIRDLHILPTFATSYGWLDGDSNWTQVCQAVLAAGAIAIFDEEPALAKKTLQRSIEGTRGAMRMYEPDGVFPEGPGYWEFGTSYNVLLLAALDVAYGHTFGLLEGSAIAKSPDFIRHITGPTGHVFNFSDNRSQPRIGMGALWLARMTDQPGMAAAEEASARRILALDEHPWPHLLPFRLFWMTRDAPESMETLPLSFLGRGRNPLAAHRTSWTDHDALFFAVKGGRPSAPHGHMDAGSFVLEADGIRWAHDLGLQDYYEIESRGMNLWDLGQDGDRWKVYRLNTFSHNTLVIGGRPQKVDGLATIVEFSDDPANRSTTVDLTPVYAGQATKVLRRIAIVDASHFVFEDTLEGVAPGEMVRWAFLTKASVRHRKDGEVGLEQDGRELRLTVRADGAARPIRWEEFSTEPPNEWDSPNPDTRQVGFFAEATDAPLQLFIEARPGH